MVLFGATKDRKLMEQLNKEMYELYMHKIEVYKLNFRTETYSDFYHEDINRDITDAPSYMVEAHCNVADNGIAALYKQGQQIDRQLWLYMSRKGLEDTLKLLGFDMYRDVPTDGDVVRIQDTYWEIITADPEGFHMNDRRYPFDYQYNIVPWERSAIPKDETRKEFKRY
jgi:hypothetical protein